jgi:23S rRNA pseudouridine2457 synthase
MGDESDICERNPPIRFRKNAPASWITISLTEGKNRQVRKMTAVVGFPTFRLIRVSIERLNIEKMKPGNVKKISRDEIIKLLLSQKAKALLH